MFGGSQFGGMMFGGLGAAETAIIMILATIALSPRIACAIQIAPAVLGPSVEISPLIDATSEVFGDE